MTRRSAWVRLALVAGVSIAALVVWRAPKAPRDDVVSTVVCYVALSNDLAPLLGIETSDAAAVSPECAATGREHSPRGGVG